MPDEVILEVTTIEENVTVETTAGDVVEIQVLAPTGTAATVAVGTTTTLAPGSSATVVNAGTSSAAVFNFGIPTGATGATGASGGSSTAWNYRAKTNATSGYPGNGYLLWNNATQLSATNILVSHLNDDGTDVELLLSFFAQGQKIFIQNRDNSSQNQVWEITGTPTVTGANTSTAYYTFPVTLVSSAGSAFTNNHSILFGSIAAAVNEVTSATTSDGTASLNISNLTLSQDVTSGIQTKMTFTANPTAVGDGQQIIWQWYNGGSPITTAAITTEATGSTSDKLLFKTSFGASVATSLDLSYTLATFSGSISSLGESYRTSSTFTYGTGVAATHRTALGLTTLATTTPAANVATFLETPNSANLAAAVTGETGTGALVFGTSPTIDAPTLSGSAAFTSTTRPTSAGTGTPAATSLITAADGDIRYGGPIYDLDGSGSNSETTATTPIKTVILPVGTYLIEFGRLTASHTDATSRTVSCTINFSGGTATIQDRYVGFQGNQASPGAGVNFAGSGTSMVNSGSIGNASPNFGSGSFPFGGRIVVTVQTTLRIFGTCSVTPTNPISYETSGILRKII